MSEQLSEQLITFNTAKLAKEKKFGLDSYTGFVFDKNGAELDLAFYDMKDKYARPAQSLLQTWLRKVHKIYAIPFPELDKWVLEIKELRGINGNSVITGYHDLEYNTYEEALEVGLQQALKLIP